MNNSDQTPAPEPNTNPPPQPPPYPGSWREQRRAERDAFRQQRHELRDQMRGNWNYGWLGGAVLILIGIIFLLENFGIYTLQNWWALFIMIPAIAAFGNAWASYKMNGRLNASGRGSLTGGFILTLLTVVLLFGINFGVYWPLLLVLGGLVLLINAILPG